jgi:uncharacterized protein
MKWVLFVFLCIALVPLADANSGGLTLLAVSETPSGFVGSLAELELEISHGRGRVFIDSYPLTKIDTQISTRLARDIACNYLELDCSGLDFYYSIRASSPIVGGPSAGAAITVLTIAVLQGKRLDPGIAVTGTINSGAFIGPVGGIFEKLKVAANGIELVLVPTGAVVMNGTNMSLDISDYAGSLGLDVREVSHISEAMMYYQGKEPDRAEEEVEINPAYVQTMGMLAHRLCSRTEELAVQAAGLNKSQLEEVYNLSAKAELSLMNGQAYSAASFCFGANAIARELIVVQTYNRTVLPMLLGGLKQDIIDYRKGLPRYKTLTDLETYAIVVERLHEAEMILDRGIAALVEGDELTAMKRYAYAYERKYSAESWAEFFGSFGFEQEFELEGLKEPCMQKLWEARERVQYLEVYLPYELLTDIETELEKAVAYNDEGAYELCIFKASKLKAQADAVLSSIGSSRDTLGKVVAERLRFIRQNVAEQVRAGHFPIVGYSYLEYSNSLISSNPSSAFLYAEYARELSNLDMYFPQKAKQRPVVFNSRVLLPAAWGLFLGLILGILISRNLKKTHPGGQATRSGKKR